MPNGVEPIVGDVTLEETIARAVTRAGEIHGLGTIAGISRSGVAIDAIDPHEWDQIFAVNVKASWRWLVGALPAMRAGGGGSVVMVASQLAFGGGRFNASYIASKGAIVSLVKTAGFELAEVRMANHVSAWLQSSLGANLSFGQWRAHPIRHNFTRMVSCSSIV